MGLRGSCWAVPGAQVARLLSMPERSCGAPAAEPLDARLGVDALPERPLLEARVPSRGVLMSLGLHFREASMSTASEPLVGGIYLAWAIGTGYYCPLLSGVNALS